MSFVAASRLQTNDTLESVARLVYILLGAENAKKVRKTHRKASVQFTISATGCVLLALSTTLSFCTRRRNTLGS